LAVKKSRLFEPFWALKSKASCGEFLDFRRMLKISAFLFEALIFFVTFFYQEKKVKRVKLNSINALITKYLILKFNINRNDLWKMM